MTFPQKLSLIPSALTLPLANEQWLSEIIIAALAKLPIENEFVALDFFKDGVPFDVDSANFLKEKSENLSDLTKLPASFRITNTQLLSADILKICKVLEQKYNKSFTCNLYYTPGEKRNCFDFHADFQLTYICQLIGQKEWFFPILENEEHLFYYKDAPDLKEICGKLESKKILLQEGDQIFVPHCMVHSVQIRGLGPSLHLTFGSQEHTQDEVLDLFLRGIYLDYGFERRAKMPVSEKDIVGLIESLKTAINETSIEEFTKMYSQKMFADNLKVLKQGRFYKKKQPL